MKPHLHLLWIAALSLATIGGMHHSVLCVVAAIFLGVLREGFF